MRSVNNMIISLIPTIQSEYPYYSKILDTINQNLFMCVNGSMAQVNTATFGELFLITSNLIDEPINLSFWDAVHPRIRSVSLSLYSDGYFKAAAEAAIKEVEQRLREAFAEAKPASKEPKNATEIVNALLSENGSYHVSARKTPSEISFSRGVKLLFEGFLASYRNPSSHGNKSVSKRESIEQIILSSQLIYILDNGFVADTETE